MPNYEELAKGINQPFGGVGQMQPAPGADPGFKPTLDPVLLLNAAKAVGEYFKNQITQPIQGTMDAARMGQYNVAPGQGVAPNPMNPLGATMMGIGAGWKGGLPAGETGVGLLAGTKAAKRPTGLSNAVEMKSKGIDVDSIWKNTGWRSDPKGNWAFEIDDSAMKLKVDFEKWKRQVRPSDFKLSDLIDHPNLFENYPQLADVKVELGIGRNSHWDRKNRIIKIGADTDSSRKSIIHEIQHAVQEIEGWPKGTHSGDYRYRSHFGEFQARDSTARIDFAKKDREIVPPYSSEMEPKDGWIYK